MGEIVLTGYTGFIGRKLRLARDRQNLPTHLWNLRHINWKEFLGARSEGFSNCVVVHLAGETNVLKSWDHPERTIANNLRCLLEVLEFCRHTGGRVVMASTAFSEDQKIASSEEEESPNSPYHLSKAISEELCRYFSSAYGVNCQILRIFSVYGDSQPTSSLIPTVIQQVVSSSDEIQIQSLHAIRDFVHVDDVVMAIECAIRANPMGFSSYQIGTGQGTSVEDLIELIQSLAGTQKQVVTVGGLHQKDRNCVVAQTDDCRSLGWKAQTSLREGLETLLPRLKNTTDA